MSELSRAQAARLVERQLKAREAFRSGAARPATATVAADAPHPSYIAVSRPHYTQASLISAEVAKRLGWQLYDRELVDAVAEDAHLKESLIEQLDERELGQIDEIMAAITGQSAGKLHEYNRSLLRVVRGLGELGQVVIVGRGADRILPPENGLRVHLVAPEARRVERLMAALGGTERAAREQLHQLDREREGWRRRTFAPPDPGVPTFDLELNTGSFSVEACADLIIHALRAKCPHAILGPAA